MEEASSYDCPVIFPIAVLLVALSLPIALMFYRSGMVSTGMDISFDSAPILEIDRRVLNGSNSETVTRARFAMNEETTLQIRGDSASTNIRVLTPPPNVSDEAVTNRPNNWRCACEGGFLPPGMFGNMESFMKMGSGQCYHKQD